MGCQPTEQRQPVRKSQITLHAKNPRSIPKTALRQLQGKDTEAGFEQNRQDTSRHWLTDDERRHGCNQLKQLNITLKS